jgi:hypothetical protein
MMKMTSWINRTFAAAALLVLNGAFAFGQSHFDVDVPFTFRAAGETMVPGQYQITRLHTNAVAYYKLQHESGKAVLVVASSPTDRKGDRSTGEAVFQCAGEYCALKAIYPAFESVGSNIPMQLKKGGIRGTETAEIRIPAVR